MDTGFDSILHVKWTRYLIKRLNKIDDPRKVVSKIKNCNLTLNLHVPSLTIIFNEPIEGYKVIFTYRIIIKRYKKSVLYLTQILPGDDFPSLTVSS